MAEAMSANAVDTAAAEVLLLGAVQSTTGYGAAKHEAAGQEERSDTVELNRWLHGPARESFWLTRLVLLRCMGAVYLAAFLTSGLQSRQLLGPNGLSPAMAGPSFTGSEYLFSPFSKEPSQNHELYPGSRPTPAFALLGLTDVSIAVVSWTGFFLSLVLLSGECTSMLIPAGLWVLWLSVVNLNSPFISKYGWEWQVCETGLLIVCLCHLPSCSNSWWPSRKKDFPQECPTPYPVLLLLRWLCFRVMIGAGLSKIDPIHWRAEPPRSHCWEDLTCTTTHYETTGAPNPIGYFMHKQPMMFHKGEVLLNHLVELVVPWFFLVPICEVRRFAACISLFFMVCIACTGNYAYINHITAVPMIACLDDALLAYLFSTSVVNEACMAHQVCKRQESRSWWSYVISGQWPWHPAVAEQYRDKPWAGIWRVCDFFLRHAIYLGLVFMIARKAVAPLQNTFGNSPWLEFYDDYFIENAYGVFGFVNQVRVEMTLSYLPHGAQRSEGAWEPLDFHCKPSSLDRMPCIVNPYHDRFDWVTWIGTTCGLELPYLHGYLHSFNVPAHVETAVSKLLRGDTDMAGLFGTPLDKLFRNGRPPAQVRAELWVYSFSSISDLISHGNWWQRKAIVTGDQAVQHVGSGLEPGQISQLPPSHDYILLTSTVGGFMAALGLEDRPGDFFWRKPSVLLGFYLLTFGIFRTFMSRVFLAHWFAALAVLVAYAKIRTGQFSSAFWKLFWKELPNVLPPKIPMEDAQYHSQFNRFRFLNIILACDFLMIFLTVIFFPQSEMYWATVVLAILGLCSVGTGIRHAAEYIDGISVGAALVLFALMLEAGRAACFRPPLPFM